MTHEQSGRLDAYVAAWRSYAPALISGDTVIAQGETRYTWYVHHPKGDAAA